MNYARLRLKIIKSEGREQLHFIVVPDQDKGESRIVIDAVVDGRQPVAWFFENKNKIENERFPFDMKEGESIAEAVERTFEELDEDDDYLIDRFYEYRESHGLRFAFRGQDLPDAYFGINDGYHEVSLKDRDHFFVYRFDAKELYKELSDYM